MTQTQTQSTLNADTLAQFVNAYLQCAIWSSMDDDGTPLDLKGYSIYDFDAGSVEQATADCQLFIAQVVKYTDFDAYTHLREQGGHDLWLTRNSHGAGFWDRPEIYGKFNSSMLTHHAKLLKEAHVFEGFNGKLYIESL
jgi:hypothetical protein